MVDNFPEFCFSFEDPRANATIIIPAKMKMVKDAKQNTVFLATIVFSQHNNWWRTTGYEMEEESRMSGSLKLLISLSHSKSDIVVTTQDTTKIHIKLLVDIFPKRNHLLSKVVKFESFCSAYPTNSESKSSCCLDIPHTRRPVLLT